VKTLLIVYHTHGVKTARMAEAVERGAQAALHEAQAADSVRVIVKRCAEADAEDLLAEAVAQAIRNYDKLRDETRFRAWFLRLMRNLHIDHLRRRKRQLDVADFGGDQIIWERLGRYPTLSGPQRKTELRSVFRALDRLPEGLRLPLALTALEGYNLKEVGQIMGISAGAVKVRIHRARKKLQDFLGEGFEVGL